MSLENKSYDELLDKIGGFGRFQLFASMSILFGITGGCFWSQDMNLLELIPQYECNLQSDGIWSECTPQTFCGTEIEHRVNWDSPYSLNNWVQQLNLECTDSYKIGLLGSLGFVGWVVALLFVPRLADRFGRKWIVEVSTIVSAVAHLGLLLSKDLMFIYACLLITGLTLAGRVSVAYIYLMELLSVNSRTLVETTILVVEPLIGVFGAIVFKYFHTVSYTYFGYIGLALILLSCFMTLMLPESPIFLLKNDQ